MPGAQWQVQSEPGDKVAISEKDGCLSIDYDVDIHKVTQLGNQSLKETRFRLTLKDAKPLDPEETRIVFEARGIDPNFANQGKGPVIYPHIIDQNGESLFYQPGLCPQLKPTPDGWVKWMSSYFYASEAGGATQNVFDSAGGDRNAWPDGKLGFAGFEVRVRALEFGRQHGTLQIGSIHTAGTRLPPADLFAFADSLLKDKGDYTVAAQVRNQFQGAPVQEYTRKFSYDPENLQSRKQQITFPLGDVGSYWINYQIADAAGKVVAGERMRFEQSDAPTTPAPTKAVDLTSPPVMGVLRINPDAHSDGVYDTNEPLVAKVRVFAKGAGTINLSWRLRQFEYDTTCSEGKQAVDFAGKPFVDVTLEIPWQAGHDAYQLLVNAESNGTVVDQQQYVLGRKTDLSRPRTTRVGAPIDRQKIKSSAYFHITYAGGADKKFPSEDVAVADFIAYIDQASQITQNLTYMIGLEEFLILPGVYDMALLDRLMDAATDRGCTISIRFGVHYVPGSADGFTYLRYGRQQNFDGTPILEHIYGGGFTLTNADYVAGWMNAFRAVHDRYRSHPAFRGYYLLQPAGETTIFDKPWEGQIAGYESTTVEAFRKYLQNDLGLSLEQLNARWGTTFPDWAQVAAPMPDFTTGKAPDLRRQWLDFCLFKVQLGEWWFRYASSQIRSFDTEHLLIAYGGLDSAKPEALAKWVDYLHNGGNHFLQGEGRLVNAWKQGMGWITEPHHPYYWAAYGDPRGDGQGAAKGAGWVLDWSIYVALAQAGGGGANLHVYYAPNLPNPLINHYGGIPAYDRLERFKPILRELHGIQLTETVREVATLQDPYTIYCKHRTTFTPRLADLGKYLELLKSDSVDAEILRGDHIGQYKLLVPNLIDEVMSQQNITKLRDGVRGGAKMLIAANTGKYSPESGTTPFQLLTALGIQSPTGDYVLGERGVKAEVSDANPLFDKGKTVQFYSLADMQADLLDPKVQKAFFAWPYRWLPQTDYFGYYRDNLNTNGQVLARFPSGAVALSLHTVGKGQVIVFWGTPDIRPESLAGMMSRAADWAGVVNPRRGSPVPNLLEANNPDIGRHYAIMYQTLPGAYQLKLPQVPDGKWFIDDMVDGMKLGTYTGTELREQGIKLDFVMGASPMKILRMLPDGQLTPEWTDLYRKPN